MEKIWEEESVYDNEVGGSLGFVPRCQGVLGKASLFEKAWHFQYLVVKIRVFLSSHLLVQAPSFMQPY